MTTVPILIGSKNAESMTGRSWSWWRRNAEKLGIELVTIGVATFARASDVLAAVDRHAVKPEPLATVDQLAAFRERIARAG